MATLKIVESVTPTVLSCRKVPIYVEDDVKQELNRLVHKGVLERVTEPTERVSQLAIVHKNNGKLRIYIDPQPLNVALQREHYRLPVLDDVLPKLKDVCVWFVCVSFFLCCASTVYVLLVRRLFCFVFFFLEFLFLSLFVFTNI